MSTVSFDQTLKIVELFFITDIMHSIASSKIQTFSCCNLVTNASTWQRSKSKLAVPSLLPFP